MINISKLVPNLMDKKICSAVSQPLPDIKLGLKLTKVHHILKFKEKHWMELYIQLPTEIRKKSKSVFEKDFYKGMTNSVSGKRMENLRKRADIKLAKTDSSEHEKLRKIIVKPYFNSLMNYLQYKSTKQK